VGRSVGGWTVGDVERSLWVVVIGMKDESRCIRYADCSAIGANKSSELQRGTHCLGIFSTFRRLKMSTQTFHPSKLLKSLELLSKVRTQINPNRINLKLQHELSSREPTPPKHVCNVFNNLPRRPSYKCGGRHDVSQQKLSQ
jgi:hypothetical protein